MQKKEIKIFENVDFTVRVKVDENGNYQFEAESIARSLGFVEQKNGWLG